MIDSFLIRRVVEGVVRRAVIYFEFFLIFVCKVICWYDVVKIDEKMLEIAVWKLDGDI